MKIHFILFGILLSAQSSFAQKSLLGRFLNSATKEHQEQNLVLTKKTFTMPAFGGAEFRVRNRAFDFEGQRYSLKLEPRGFGETNALHRFKQAQSDYEKIHNQYLLNDKLLSRYNYFIDILERKSLATSYKELILVYEDRIKVMEQLQNSTDFDLTDLIKAEKELAKLISEKIEEEQEVQTANKYIAFTCGDSLGGDIDTAGLISVTAIKKSLENINAEFNKDKNIYLKDLKSEFDCSENRYKLAKAKDSKLINFLEFSYDFGSLNEEYVQREKLKKYNLNNAYIFEVGLNIPGFSSDDDALMRYKMDYSFKKSEYESLQKEMAAKIKKDLSDINAYIERYELIGARETEADAEASLKKYMQLSGVDPLVLLSIQESLIKNRFEKEKVYFSILRNFIYVMDVTGKLTEKPIRNFLSAQDELLAE